MIYQITFKNILQSNPFIYVFTSHAISEGSTFKTSNVEKLSSYCQLVLIPCNCTYLIRSRLVNA